MLLIGRWRKFDQTILLLKIYSYAHRALFVRGEGKFFCNGGTIKFSLSHFFQTQCSTDSTRVIHKTRHDMRMVSRCQPTSSMNSRTDTLPNVILAAFQSDRHGTPAETDLPIFPFTVSLHLIFFSLRSLFSIALNTLLARAAQLLFGGQKLLPWSYSVEEYQNLSDA